jgi:hypothetical protein
MLAAPVGGQVELLLRERRQQQPEPFELLGIQDAVEELVEIVRGDEASARHQAPRCQSVSPGVPSNWSTR